MVTTRLLALSIARLVISTTALFSAADQPFPLHISLHVWAGGVVEAAGCSGQVATVEATRLDEQQAPQRDIDRQQKLTVENRFKQETARRVNKAAFRP